MKKSYNIPEIEIIETKAADVIATSAEPPKAFSKIITDDLKIFFGVN